MGLLNLLSALFGILLSFADILLWPEEALNRELRLRRKIARHGESHSLGEACHRAFIVSAIIVLCLLLVWI